jgi:hypothetical protein
VVSDETTRAILGERVERALGGRFDVESVVLRDRPHADEETARRVADATAAPTRWSPSVPARSTISASSPRRARASPTSSTPPRRR